MWTLTLAILVPAVLLIAEAVPSIPFQKRKICDHQRSDFGECSRRLVQAALRHFKDGKEDLGIAPFDPLEVEAIRITEDSMDNNLQLNITQIQLKGLSTSEVSSVRISPYDRTFEVNGTMPLFKVIGDYSMDGSVSGMAIWGSGESILTMENTQLRIAYTGNLVQKGCQLFLNITNYSFEIQPEKINFQFENLYDSNESQASVILDLMNQYSKEVFIVVSARFNEELTRATWPALQKFHDKWAYNDIFPEFPMPCR